MGLAEENELFRMLLDANQQAEVEQFLAKVLELAREVTGADVAYLAIGHGFSSASPQWWLANAPADDVTSIRAQLSTSLMEQANKDGLVHTTDAIVDARFRNSPSVRDNQIRGVLCVALKSVQNTSIGVVYLMGAPGSRFDEHRGLAQLLGTHLGPIAERVLLSLRGSEPDPTQAFRAHLPFERLVGHSAALAKVMRQLQVVAAAPVPVLLTGPTGTGKTTIAEVLHEASGIEGRFVSVNASHLSKDLAMAELFGARRGAYTGLERDREGLVERADGGTLFLDEVTELDLEVQAQLLTFLQDGAYRRLGDPDSRRVQRVRVISATNRSLDEAVAQGAFRDDLRYRLAAMTIEVPALDDRPEDVVPLAFALVDRHALRFGIRARPLSAAACAWLEARRWPGNIRELENVLQAGLLWAHNDRAAAIRPEHLHREPSDVPTPEHPHDLRSAVERFRLTFVRRVLDEAGGNKSEAARRLGIHRSYLHDLLNADSATASSTTD